MSDLITINVGGTLFTTAKSNINIKGSIFETMLNGEFKVNKDKNGNIFLDKNPYLFAEILDQLRDSGKCKKIVIDRNNNKLKKEVLFYGLKYKLQRHKILEIYLDQKIVRACSCPYWKQKCNCDMDCWETKNIFYDDVFGDGEDLYGQLDSFQEVLKFINELEDIKKSKYKYIYDLDHVNIDVYNYDFGDYKLVKYTFSDSHVFDDNDFAIVSINRKHKLILKLNV